MSTQNQITKRSAQKLGETLTTDLIDVMKRWSYPKELWDIPARLVFNVDAPNVEEYLNSAKTFTEMGGTLRENEVRNVLGFGDVADGDKVLGGVAKIPGAGGGGIPMDPNGQPAKPKPESTFAGDQKPAKPLEHTGNGRIAIQN